MVARGADVVISEDFDVLPYLAGISQGNGILVTGFCTQRMVAYDIARVLEAMGMTPHEFIDVCIIQLRLLLQNGIAIFRAYSSFASTTRSRLSGEPR